MGWLGCVCVLVVCACWFVGAHGLVGLRVWVGLLSRMGWLGGACGLFGWLVWVGWVADLDVL